ncbi:MAG: hypothetical protein HUJ69_04590 [Lachnospiraceae bacterium]|nr:hypothetical protein [Lachnospiraceae bacterium]
MNTMQRKQLARLIFPSLILIAMVVLIIMAKVRDAKRLEATMNASSAVTETASGESSEASESSIVSPTGATTVITDMDPTGEAKPLEELEGAIGLFDGKVAVSYIGMDEETSTISIRIDNMYGEEITTQGFPKTQVDGADVLLNPLGKNQKLNYVKIPDGEYVLISYKVDARCFSCDSLEITAGFVKILSTEELDEYAFTIK